jgi:hypothetical protein
MNHLNEATRKVLELSDEDRIQYILGERWVGYTAANKTLADLDRLLRHPKVSRMPNRLIVSDTNNGKTSLVRRFVLLHQRSDDPKLEASNVPILLIQAPPTPDIRAFFTSILDDLRMPYARTERTEVLFSQVKAAVPRLGVRMLVIDEIQHLIAGADRKHHAFLNVIKYFSNEWMLPIVAVGTTEAYRAVQADMQVANRFRPVELPRWKNNDEFRRLLRSFEFLLPLRKASDLAHPEMALRLSLMAEGTIGELSTLLNEAAIEAIVGGEERLTDHVLDRIGWIPPTERKRRPNA